MRKGPNRPVKLHRLAKILKLHMYTAIKLKYTSRKPIIMVLIRLHGGSTQSDLHLCCLHATKSVRPIYHTEEQWKSYKNDL